MSFIAPLKLPWYSGAARTTPDACDTSSRRRFVSGESGRSPGSGRSSVAGSRTSSGSRSRRLSEKSAVHARGSWPTQSSAQRVGLNVMRFAASTSVCLVQSARPEPRGGNTGGEQGHRARCSPLSRARDSGSAASWCRMACEASTAKSLPHCWLRLSRTGGAPCRPLAGGCRTAGSLREPWRE